MKNRINKSVSLVSLLIGILLNKGSAQEIIPNKDPDVILSHGSININNGGYGSGMAKHPIKANTYYMLTDRGPNLKAPGGIKVFPKADYAPQIGLFKVVDGLLIKEKVITLKDKDGNNLTGLPNPIGFGGTGEIAKDLDGNDLSLSKTGVDPEGIVALEDGSFWVSDEYGPHIIHFDSEGKTIERINPFGSGHGGRALPKVFGNRRPNRGMEGLTITPDGKTLVGIMQTAMYNPPADKDNIKSNSRISRIITFDIETGDTKQYVYIQEAASLSNSEIRAVSNTEFIVLERDGKFWGDQVDPAVFKRFYHIDLSKATDVSDPENGHLGLMYGPDVPENGWITIDFEAGYEIGDYSEKGIGVVAIEKSIPAETIITFVGLGEFLVTENAELGSTVLKGVLSVASLKNAERNYLAPKRTLEQLSAAELSDFGIVPVSKDLYLDLLADMPNYQHDKPEGFSILADGSLAIINDDDFGIMSDINGNMLQKNLPNGAVDSNVLYIVPRNPVLARLADEVQSVFTPKLTLEKGASYKTGVFDESAAEMVAFDYHTKRAFVSNSDSNGIDILDVSDPENIRLVKQIKDLGGNVNCVDVSQYGIAAIAVENNDATQNGFVVFVDALTGSELNRLRTGVWPDNVVWSPDGTKVITADEGQPNDDNTVDPEGSVTIVDLGNGSLRDVVLSMQSDVNIVTFNHLNFLSDLLQDYGVRIFGEIYDNNGEFVRKSTLAEDFEPEYTAISPDSKTAYVTLQENNAFVIIDIESGELVDLVPMGYKDHSLPNNGFDSSNKDDRINIRTWPTLGMYQPDAVHAYEAFGETFLVTANEGDARDYDNFSEETRVAKLDLDPAAYPNAEWLQKSENLGRLKTTTATGDYDGDGDIDQIYSYGARSFSIWDSQGNLVWDSGDQLEQITAKLHPEDFNSTNDENDSFDNRSDDKGPEPEAIAIGKVGHNTFAFIGLERMGGIAVYDITFPHNPSFMDFLHTRDFSSEEYTNFDMGPEDIHFVDAKHSSTGKPILLISNEVSGTTTVAKINYEPSKESPYFKLQLLHASDLEEGGSNEDLEAAVNFAALVDGFQKHEPNTILLSAGDNFLPGPFFNAAGDYSMRAVFNEVYNDFFGLPSDLDGDGNEDSYGDLRPEAGYADIALMNIIGFDASAVGNHEFDAGTEVFDQAINHYPRGAGLSNDRGVGALFPYLSANLDFANSSMSSLYTSEILESSEFGVNPEDALKVEAKYGGYGSKHLAPATILDVNGTKIGVLGATTPRVEFISSPGDVKVSPADSDDRVETMKALAKVLQPTIDKLSKSTDKIVLLSHLQQFGNEIELIKHLRGVDIIIAGGSDTVLADENDDLLPADTTVTGSYPYLAKDGNGDPALLVSTAGRYRYVGRLNVEFSPRGTILVDRFDSSINGPVAAIEKNVKALWGDEDPESKGTKAALARKLVEGVRQIVVDKDGDVYGYTKTYLAGDRATIRTEETNLGNLAADAQLWAAKQIDSSISVALKNGGGLRASIGEVITLADGSVVYSGPQKTSYKGEGAITMLDLENTQRFNNSLTAVTLTASGLREIMEHGVAGSVPGDQPGRFPQVGGMRFSFKYDEDFSEEEGIQRIKSLVITNEDGSIKDIVVKNGLLVGDPNRMIRMVSLGFLVGGGDGYPFEELGSNIVGLTDTEGNKIREQMAFGSYLKEFYGSLDKAFSLNETSPERDLRIQNLMYRDDSVFGNPLMAGKVQLRVNNGTLEIYWDSVEGTTLQKSYNLIDWTEIEDVQNGVYLPVLNEPAAFFRLSYE